jgi:PKD repeat protein
VSYRIGVFACVVLVCAWTLLVGCPPAQQTILPAAAFSATPESGNAPLTVVFSDESLEGSDAVTSFLWDFGDGSTSDEADPTHTYAQAGVYDVSLRVETAAGEDTTLAEDFITALDFCDIADSWLVQPPEQAVIVLGSGAVNHPMILSGTTDCPANTSKLLFNLDGSPAVIGLSPAFTATSGMVSDLAVGQHVVDYSAVSLAFASYPFQSTFSVVEASEGDDADSNGLPDNVFTRLPGDGDMWYSVVEAPDWSGLRTVGVIRWDGAEGSAETPPLSMILRSQYSGEVAVQVSVPRNLAQAGETGVLIVEIAPDPEALLGVEEAALLAVGPAVLTETIPVVEISVLVTSDSGVTFDEVDNALLAANPVHLSLDGLQSGAVDAAAFYAHPSFADSDAESGLAIIAETGAWSQDSFSGVEAGANRVDMDLTSLSVFAAFGEYTAPVKPEEGEGEGVQEGEVEGEVVEEGEGEGEGGGGPAEGEPEGEPEPEGEGEGEYLPEGEDEAPAEIADLLGDITVTKESDFTATVRMEQAPLSTTFNGVSSLEDEADVAWAWSFGDGVQSTERHPDHAYAIPGLYTVSLTVTGGGKTSTETKLNYITVETPVVSEVAFSHTRGFYESAFDLTLSTRQSDVEIRYTLDGTLPTESHGSVYSAPLSVSATSTVRATVIEFGLSEPPVKTHTFVFVDDVITQSASGVAPPGWPSGMVNDQVMDYGMDPDVTGDPRYSGVMDDALLAIPSLSIVTEPDNFFGASTGILVNAKQRGIEWERPISLELLSPDGGDTFQIDAGARVRGGWSRDGGNPKHAFRLYFRGEYGETKLRFPLFGDEGTDEFDKIDLRTSTDYSWTMGDFDGAGLGDLNTLTRDVFSRDSQRDMNQPYTRSRYYHVYINGQYWGVFQSQERSEARYAESYFGGDYLDYDVIKRRSEAVDGNVDAWTALYDAHMAGFGTDAAYHNVLGQNSDGTRNPSSDILVDLDNLIDHMLVVFYSGNFDAPISWWYDSGPDPHNTGSNNIWAIYNRANPDGFKFFAHDFEHTLLAHLAGSGSWPFEQIDASVDRTGPYWHADLETLYHNNPQTIHQKMASHPEYRLRFADRVQRFFFNGGALTSAASIARFGARASELEMAIIGESARWGDATVSTPRTKDDNWQPVMDGIINDFFPTRGNIVLEQLKAQNWFPSDIIAPSFEVDGAAMHGASVGAGQSLTINNPNASGTIYYTLDGSDVTLPLQFDTGTADPAPGAMEYTDAITVQQTVRLKARVLIDSTWSPLSEADYALNTVAQDLRVSEIMYQPPLVPVGNPDAEFIELKNVGAAPVNLFLVHFTDGINFSFPNMTLAPGEHVVVVRDELIFEAQYGPGINIAGVYTGRLSNGGERIALADASGQLITDFSYKDGWRSLTNGGGYSLNVIDDSLDPFVDWSSKDNWRNSSLTGGSPGRADEDLIPMPGEIRINEVLAHSHDVAPDWIELYNSSAATIDLSGWYLSDSALNLKKYQLPAGTTIAANGYLLFYEDEHFNNASDPGVLETFSLSKAGDAVFLSSAVGGVLSGYQVDVDFDASISGVSFGKYETLDGDTNFPPLSAITPGTANAAPIVWPMAITEIMYDPSSDNQAEEYVELYNDTDANILLHGEGGFPWRFTSGINFTFPGGTVLPAHSYLIVAKDPAACVARYSIPGGVQVLGPYGGQLSDGEGLQLSVPGDENADGIRGHIRLERVRYGATAPWPEGADGGGSSLQRIDVSLYGNDANNWDAALPTPGS